MGMFGKMGSMLSSPTAKMLGKTAIDIILPPLGAERRITEARQRREMQTQQEQQALADLMSQMRPQDARTPQVNELIGEANRVNAPRGGSPMDMITPDRAGLDPSDPNTIQALAKYAGMGGNLQLPLALSQWMQPEKPPEPRYIEGPNGIYAAGPNGVSMVQPYPVDPLQAELKRAQIASTRAQEQQRIHMAAKPYFAPPRAAGGGTVTGNNPWDKYKR